MNHYVAQRKSWIVALASGLTVLLVIGLGLLQENSPTLALTEAQVYATAEEATWIAIAKYAPDKATAEAIGKLTLAALPTPTWFDAFATGEALDQMLTTSPTPGPTEPPMLLIQRPAGAGRLVADPKRMCGEYNFHCGVQNVWLEKVKDKFIVVAAASRVYSDGSSEAILIVEWQSLADQKRLAGGGVFPVPVPARSAMIVDAQGEQLTLRTGDGELLIFDVPSQQYISLPPPQLSAQAQHQVEGGAVIEKSDVPFTLPEFNAINRWSGKNANGRLTIFAGGSNKSFAQGKGKLAIVTSKGEPTAADVPQVYTLTDTTARGALWIFDIKGNLITLVDWTGHEIFFDLAKRQFISAGEAWPKVFTAPLFDPSMPISQATPAPVTPFVPPTPVSTSVSNAYP